MTPLREGPLLSTLADAIASEARKGSGKCTTGILLGRLPKAEAADLQAALDDDLGVSAALLERAMRTLGHALRAENIRVHRKGECACPRAV
jgi:hypothetical protein